MVLFFPLCSTLHRDPNRIERRKERFGKLAVRNSKISGCSTARVSFVQVTSCVTYQTVPTIERTRDTRGQTASLFSYNHNLSVMPHCLSTAFYLPLIGRLLQQNNRYVPLSSRFYQPCGKPAYGNLDRPHDISIPGYSPRSAPTSHESQLRRYAL